MMNEYGDPKVEQEVWLMYDLAQISQELESLVHCLRRSGAVGGMSMMVNGDGISLQDYLVLERTRSLFRFEREEPYRTIPGLLKTVHETHPELEVTATEAEGLFETFNWYVFSGHHEFQDAFFGLMRTARDVIARKNPNWRVGPGRRSASELRANLGVLVEVSREELGFSYHHQMLERMHGEVSEIEEGYACAPNVNVWEGVANSFEQKYKEVGRLNESLRLQAIISAIALEGLGRIRRECSRYSVVEV